MMRKRTIALVVASLMIVPAFAEKPAGAGDGKPMVEQRDAQKAATGVQDEVEVQRKEKLEKQEKEQEKMLKREKEKRKEHMSDAKGEENNEQIQKELGKGSEQGQKARETRRKWWQFWGD